MAKYIIATETSKMLTNILPEQTIGDLVSTAV